MAKSHPMRPAPVDSDADFASALTQIGAEIDHQPLRSLALGMCRPLPTVKFCRPAGTRGEGDIILRTAAKTAHTTSMHRTLYANIRLLIR